MYQAIYIQIQLRLRKRNVL